ncbi:hypothetical protein SADUNF_Sadunf03G0117100 [Salix dunnii]|uniref:Uncharacterized protein n=1 Tax=Salix dunnii TaxID=1413687 RepID=A0A835TDU2_9ROSI|nr:hypothetical protein SADUNF_Sadunf03G0117100 [Salix dunnii]
MAFCLLGKEKKPCLPVIPRSCISPTLNVSSSPDISSGTRLLFLLVLMNAVVLVCRKASSLELWGYEDREKMIRKCLLQKMRMIQARKKDHWLQGIKGIQYFKIKIKRQFIFVL